MKKAGQQHSAAQALMSPLPSRSSIRRAGPPHSSLSAPRRTPATRPAPTRAPPPPRTRARRRRTRSAIEASRRWRRATAPVVVVRRRSPSIAAHVAVAVVASVAVPVPVGEAVTITITVTVSIIVAIPVVVAISVSVSVAVPVVEPARRGCRRRRRRFTLPRCPLHHHAEQAAVQLPSVHVRHGLLGIRRRGEEDVRKAPVRGDFGVQGHLDALHLAVRGKDLLNVLLGHVLGQV